MLLFIVPFAKTKTNLTYSKIMASSSADRRQNLLKSCIKELQSCVDYVQQYSDNKGEQFSILQDITREYCEIDKEYTRAEAACEATENHFDNEENDCTKDIQEIYNKYLEEQPSSSDYQNHPIWRKINNIIQGKEADQPENNSEVSDIELLEDENRSMDEGIIPSQFEPPVDPITKKIIENPCRNRKCGHIYEYSTVIEHLNNIKQHKSKPRCPYIGCTNVNMKPSFIVKDNVLKEQIQNFIANRNNVVEANTSNSSVIL